MDIDPIICPVCLVTIGANTPEFSEKHNVDCFDNLAFHFQYYHGNQACCSCGFDPKNQGKLAEHFRELGREGMKNHVAMAAMQQL